MISILEVNSCVAFCSFRGKKVKWSFQIFKILLKPVFLAYRDAFPVVKPCTFKPPIGYAKPERRYKNERSACAGAGADNITRILRNLRLVEYDASE